MKLLKVMLLSGVAVAGIVDQSFAAGSKEGDPDSTEKVSADGSRLPPRKRPIPAVAPPVAELSEMSPGAAVQPATKKARMDLSVPYAHPGPVMTPGAAVQPAVNRPWMDSWDSYESLFGRTPGAAVPHDPKRPRLGLSGPYAYPGPGMTPGGMGQHAVNRSPLGLSGSSAHPLPGMTPGFAVQPAVKRARMDSGDDSSEYQIIRNFVTRGYLTTALEKLSALDAAENATTIVILRAIQGWKENQNLDFVSAFKGIDQKALEASRSRNINVFPYLMEMAEKVLGMKGIEESDRSMAIAQCYRLINANQRWFPKVESINALGNKIFKHYGRNRVAKVEFFAVLKEVLVDVYDHWRWQGIYPYIRPMAKRLLDIVCAEVDPSRKSPSDDVKENLRPAFLEKLMGICDVALTPKAVKMSKDLQEKLNALRPTLTLRATPAPEEARVNNRPPLLDLAQLEGARKRQKTAKGCASEAPRFRRR